MLPALLPSEARFFSRASFSAYGVPSPGSWSAVPARYGGFVTNAAKLYCHMAWGVISSLPRQVGICAVVRGTFLLAVAALSGMLGVEPPVVSSSTWLFSEQFRADGLIK